MLFLMLVVLSVLFSVVLSSSGDTTIISYDYTAKSLKYDSAQNASDVRCEIPEECVLIVRRNEWKIEATPQIGFFQRNQLRIGHTTTNEKKQA
jgi:hypothetical protein